MTHTVLKAKVPAEQTAAPAVSIKLDYPFAGGILYTLDDYIITWHAENVPPDAEFVISLSVDGGSTYNQLCEPFEPGGCSYANEIPWPAAASAYLRIEVQQNGSQLAVDEAGPFLIIDGTGEVHVTAPVKGAVLTQGTVHPIAWTHNFGLVSKFDIQLLPEGTWEDVVDVTGSSPALADTPSSGRYSWTVVAEPTSIAEIFVQPVAEDSLAFSEAFSIVAPAIRIEAPNSTTKWRIGTKQRISWYHNLGQDAHMKIELSTDGGRSWQTIAANVSTGQLIFKPPVIVPKPLPNVGFYDWKVIGSRTSAAMIRVSWRNAGYRALATSAKFVMA